MKRSLLFSLLIVSLATVHPMELVTVSAFNKENKYTPCTNKPKKSEQKSTQTYQFVDLNEEIYKRFSQGKKEEALIIVPKTSITSLFAYGIDQKNPVFIKWLLQTEDTNTDFYPLKAILDYAHRTPNPHIIALIEKRIKFREPTQRNVILENKIDTKECICIIL